MQFVVAVPIAGPGLLEALAGTVHDRSCAFGTSSYYVFHLSCTENLPHPTSKP